jgi:hypothetical protein
MCKKLNYLLSFALILALTGGLTAQGTDPGTANLTHLWTFEDGTLNDSVGEAHGTAHGDNVFVDGGDLILIAGAAGTADSWVDLPGDKIDIAAYDEVSIAAWFTPEAGNNQWETLWFFGDDGQGAGMGSDGIAFQPRRADTKARFWITTGSPSAPYNNEDGVDDVGNNYNDEGVLYHVVCQINDVPELMMYHDAVLIGTKALTSDPAAGKDNAIYNISPNFARFAHSCYAGDIPWLGEIHEIAIFNKALSDEEVTYLFEHEDWSKSVTAVDKNEAAALPSEYGLAQNYPNPFNPTTSISFDLPHRSKVNITVYDLLGKEVATLVNEVKSAGQHIVQFDGSNLSSGVYIARMDVGDQVFTRKMTLMK